MDQDELITELLQALTNDMQKISQQVSKLPTQPPADYGPGIEKLAGTVAELGRKVVGLTPPARTSTNEMDERLTRIEGSINLLRQAVEQRPEKRMSQYMQYGAYSFGLMVVLLVAVTWFAFTWKAQRDRFEVSDWKWRMVHQHAPKYAIEWDNDFATDSTKEDAQLWIIEREQADATRQAAQKVAEQAATMNAKADQLEGNQIGGQKKR